jgi:hypothetical protein
VFYNQVSADLKRFQMLCVAEVLTIACMLLLPNIETKMIVSKECESYMHNMKAMHVSIDFSVYSNITNMISGQITISYFAIPFDTQQNRVSSDF